MIRNLFVTGIFFLIVYIGVSAPKYIIDENADEFQGENEKFALYSLYAAKLISAGRFSAYKIEELEKISEVNRECALWPPGVENTVIYGDYKARIRGYTFFAIPYADIFVDCDSSSIDYLFNSE